MERITLRMPERQVQQIDELVDAGQYPSRSEAIRDCARRILKEEWPPEQRVSGQTMPFGRGQS